MRNRSWNFAVLAVSLKLFLPFSPPSPGFQAKYVAFHERVRATRPRSQQKQARSTETDPLPKNFTSCEDCRIIGGPND
jgi:hypothetical protein